MDRLTAINNDIDRRTKSSTELESASGYTKHKLRPAQIAGGKHEKNCIAVATGSVTGPVPRTT